jgi:ribose 5-phosphate isomerase B
MWYGLRRAESEGRWGLMGAKTVVIASDHAGFALKSELRDQLEAGGFDVLDLGTDGPESVDYPEFGHALARAIEDGRAERGVLVCGSGIGISMAANRHKGVRAAPCHDETSTRLARQHNDANVLALGARLVGAEVARQCLRIFLETPFEGGRHARRVAKIY